MGFVKITRAEKPTSKGKKKTGSKKMMTSWEGRGIKSILPKRIQIRKGGRGHKVSRRNSAFAAASKSNWNSSGAWQGGREKCHSTATRTAHPQANRKDPALDRDLHAGDLAMKPEERTRRVFKRGNTKEGESLLKIPGLHPGNGQGGKKNQLETRT